MAGQQFGVPPKHIQNLDYTGADIALVPVTEAQRAPTTTDKNYPIDCFWRDTTTKMLYWLSGFDSTGALWVTISSGTGQLTTLSDTAGTVVTPGPGGNIQLRSVSSGLTIVSDDPNNRLDFTISNTTNGTATTVGAVTADPITLALSATPGVYQFDIRIAAFDATTPLGAGYAVIATVRSDGATATVIGTPDKVVAEEGALSAGNVSIVGSGNNMIVRVLGTAAKTINWKAELIYTFVS